MENKGQVLSKLFISTLYLSAFTFGGGYVIVTLLKKKFVDEYHQTEILCKDEHLRIDTQSDMSGQDSYEEYECHAERHSPDLDLSQQQTDGADDRDDHHGLYRRVIDEQRFEPVHHSASPTPISSNRYDAPPIRSITNRT